MIPKCFEKVVGNFKVMKYSTNVKIFLLDVDCSAANLNLILWTYHSDVVLLIRWCKEGAILVFGSNSGFY